MSHIFKFDSEEKLRDETLQKFIEYTEEHNIRFSMDDIITFDVAKPSRINDARRLLPLLTHQLLRSSDTSTCSDKFYTSLAIICGIIADTIVMPILAVLCFIFCVPYYYFCYVLSFLSFYQLDDDELLDKYFRQNILIGKEGIFIYSKELKLEYPLDVKYSPMMRFIRWVNRLNSSDLYLVHLFEEFCFIKLNEIKYDKKKLRGFKEYIVRIIGNNNQQYLVTTEIKDIIEDTKERFLTESSMNSMV
eukprot:snap_masked-scaffold_8-processed-gene-2.33-mRNA-1 protein AED:1.00 eAED:1.00 QI:0/-1/0/0/-1/1/1/0/246